MAKQLIHLRQRKMPSGNISLYLDFSHKGVRKWEYLKLYLIDNPVTPEDKKKNRENLRLAQAIQAQRIVELQNKEYGFKSDKGNGSFLFFFQEVVDQKKGSTLETWQSTNKILKTYCNSSTRIKDIDGAFFEGLKRHLDKYESRLGKKLSNNTKWLYYSKVIAAVNLLVKSEIIFTSPAKIVTKYKIEEVQRKYVTLDELTLLFNKPIKKMHASKRRAFLFSCLTGLRWSDIEGLLWKNVFQQTDGSVRIHFKQEKTDGLEYLDINPQAAELLGERGDPSESVFQNVKYYRGLNKIISKWVESAGIERDLTFHSARHSFAIMMIDLDVDLFILSKLMGHKDVKTTQIYAKVRDKKKKEAISKIPDFSLS